jgi:2-methylisocitrate lyase-like PEP mutase family enzyme
MKYFYCTETAAQFVGTSLRNFARMAERFGVKAIPLGSQFSTRNFWALPDLQMMKNERRYWR